MLTALDQIANQNHLQIIKAIVPYLRPSSQELISVFIKVAELQNVRSFYRQNTLNLTACDAASDPPSLLDILSDIRNYCEKKEQDLIDQWIQVLSAMELYSIFSQTQGDSASET